LEVNGTIDRSVVFESLDFVGSANGEPLESVDFNGHGTRIIGIIGALRNNQKGIAGIAGGDIGNNIPSIQMHSYRVASSLPNTGTSNTINSDMVESWIHAANATGQPRIDIANHSSFTNSPDELLRETYQLAVKSGIIFVNLRGNNGNDDPIYPTNFRDEWSISVGASGTMKAIIYL